MGGAPLLLALALITADVGWESDGQDGYRYIVQVSPEQFEELAREGFVTSQIPAELQGRVTSVVVRVGEGPLPQPSIVAAASRKTPYPEPPDTVRAQSGGSGMAIPDLANGSERTVPSTSGSGITGGAGIGVQPSALGPAVPSTTPSSFGSRPGTAPNPPTANPAGTVDNRWSGSANNPANAPSTSPATAPPSFFNPAANPTTSAATNPNVNPAANPAANPTLGPTSSTVSNTFSNPQPTIPFGTGSNPATYSQPQDPPSFPSAADAAAGSRGSVGIYPGSGSVTSPTPYSGPYTNPGIANPATNPQGSSSPVPSTVALTAKEQEIADQQLLREIDFDSLGNAIDRRTGRFITSSDPRAPQVSEYVNRTNQRIAQFRAEQERLAAMGGTGVNLFDPAANSATNYANRQNFSMPTAQWQTGSERVTQLNNTGTGNMQSGAVGGSGAATGNGVDNTTLANNRNGSGAGSSVSREESSSGRSASDRDVMDERDAAAKRGPSLEPQPFYNFLLILSFVVNIYLGFAISRLLRRYRNLVATHRGSPAVLS